MLRSNGGESYRNWIIAAFALAASLAFVYGSYLFGERLFLFRDIGSDTINQFWPHYAEISRAFHEHRLLTWTFHQGLGQNLVGYYWDPLNLFMYALPEKTLPFGIVWLETLKSFLSGLFIFAWARELRSPVLTALIAAFSYVFGSYIIVTGTWSLPSTEALYTAFALFGLELVLSRKDYRFYPMAVGMLLFAQPFCLFHLGVFSGAYLVVRCKIIEEWPWARLSALAFKIVGLLILGFALSAASSLEGIALMLQSPRVGGGSLADSFLERCPPGFAGFAHLYTCFMRVLGHDLLGNGREFSGTGNYLEAPAFYSGLLSVILFPQIFLYQSRKLRICAILIMSIIVLSAVFPILRFSFWLFTGDYYRTFSLYCGIGLIALALWTLNCEARESHLSPVLLWCTIAAVSLLLFLPSPDPEIVIHRRLRMVTIIFLLLYGVVIHLSVRKKLGLLPIAAVCVFELLFMSHRALNARNVLTKVDLPKRIGYNDYTMDAMDFVRHRDSSFFRVSKYYCSGLSDLDSLNDAKIQNYFGTSSYLSFNQHSYIDYLTKVGVTDPAKESDTRWSRGLIDHPLLQAQVGVKYIFTRTVAPFFHTLKYQEIGQFGDVHVLENAHALPLAVSYDHYLTPEQYKRLPIQSRETTLFRAVVTDDLSGLVPLESSPGIDGTMESRLASFENDVSRLQTRGLRLTSFAESALEGNIEIDRVSMLVFSIPHDEGWHAWIDDQPAKIGVVDFGFSGIKLNPGLHKVTLKFQPRLLNWGVTISAIAGVIYIVLCFRQRNQVQTRITRSVYNQAGVAPLRSV